MRTVWHHLGHSESDVSIKYVRFKKKKFFSTENSSRNTSDNGDSYTSRGVRTMLRVMKDFLIYFWTSKALKTCSRWVIGEYRSSKSSTSMTCWTYGKAYFAASQTSEKLKPARRTLRRVFILVLFMKKESKLSKHLFKVILFFLAWSEKEAGSLNQSTSPWLSPSALIQADPTLKRCTDLQ